MNTAYIALGSNLRCPAQQLRAAVRALSRLPGSRLVKISPVYRSKAIGPGAQPDYLNAVAALQTDLPPQQLLAALQEIERAQGRVRTERWGARTLDLDILLYGNRVISTPELTVPHPAMTRRSFVLYPLADLTGRELMLPDGTVLGTLVADCSGADLTDAGLDLNSEAAAWT